MKQSLYFISEQEFQNFFSQLASAEISNFQAVEGAGGDKGFDGLSGQTAFQVYHPTVNLSAKKYIIKIEKDLAKVIESKAQLGLEINQWILVVPEDLSIDVVAFLQKESKETGIECLYWGASKLTELVNKFPYIKDEFPKIFLPPVREGLRNLEQQVAESSRPRVLDGSVTIIGDDEYERRKKAIRVEHQQKAVSGIRRFGDSSAAVASSIAYQRQANEKLADLKYQKERSDMAYTLELAEINEHWDEKIRQAQEDFSKRGIGGSGISLSHIGRLEISRNRDKEKLKLKYGKKS